MSDFKLKENTGFIFKNKYKQNDTQPEYKGTINVDGKEKDLALWVNKEKGYFSAKISEPYVKEEKPSTEHVEIDKTDNTHVGGYIQNDDDLPF